MTTNHLNKSTLQFFMNLKSGDMIKKKKVRQSQSDSLFPGQYIILVGERRKKREKELHYSLSPKAFKDTLILSKSPISPA